MKTEHSVALHWTKGAGSLSVLPQLQPETDVSLHINVWIDTEEEIKVEKKGINILQKALQPST